MDTDCVAGGAGLEKKNKRFAFSALASMISSTLSVTAVKPMISRPERISEEKYSYSRKSLDEQLLKQKRVGGKA